MHLTEPHHDGGPLYRPNENVELGRSTTLFVRIPNDASVDGVHVRTLIDAEPHFIEAVIDKRDDAETWWRADVDVTNPVTSYRFFLEGGPTGQGYRWLNGTGVHPTDVTDADDFRMVTYEAGPRWAQDAVFYQIFPDRFADSGAAREWPDWAIRSAWSDPVLRGGDAAMRQLYGGDLDGVRERLDHIETLGANAVYLTPFFPAESNHRYNATSFHRVDPVLGGDAALTRLADEIHRRGMRLVGDLTLNHSGDKHEWFRAALTDPTCVEARFYRFHVHPDDYATWLDVHTLPKFDLRSSELRRRLIEGSDSVVAKWLRPPFELDGWRVDVASMSGRQGEIDVNQEVARAMRSAMGLVQPDSLLLAEHCHDASSDLLGDGWHGTMFYAGFTRPVWTWLAEPDSELTFLGLPVPVPRLPGGQVVRTMRAFAASVPWTSFAHSMTLLGSHDTARWRTVSGGDPATALVGLGILLTYPGLPSIFAGDEVGLEGRDNEDARQPFPWDTAAWDQTTFSAYRSLIALRRNHAALRRGGLRWVHVGDDALVYLREHPDETILVQAARTSHEPIVLRTDLLALDGAAEHLLGGPDLIDDGGKTTLPSDGPALHVWRL